MSKHTPGPWNLTGESFGYAIGANGIRIASITDIVHKGSGGVHEQEANARLIAAAPELYAALKDILDNAVWELGKQESCGDEPDEPVIDRCISHARSALTKSERTLR